MFYDASNTCELIGANGEALHMLVLKGVYFVLQIV